MKRTVLFVLVVIIAALSVMTVSAAPRGRYYDQVGNKHWCNSDSYGCWVTGENGGKDYIMFWSEASAEAIMGKNSGAPIGTLPGSDELGLAAPIAEVAEKEESGGGKPVDPECKTDEDCTGGKKCKAGKCEEDSAQTPTCAETCTAEGMSCNDENQCVKTSCTADEKAGECSNGEWKVVNGACQCVTNDQG